MRDMVDGLLMFDGACGLSCNMEIMIVSLLCFYLNAWYYMVLCLYPYNRRSHRYILVMLREGIRDYLVLHACIHKGIGVEFRVNEFQSLVGWYKSLTVSSKTKLTGCTF